MLHASHQQFTKAMARSRRGAGKVQQAANVASGRDAVHTTDGAQKAVPAAPWPLLHALQLVGLMGVVHPAFLLLSLVDFGRLWGSGEDLSLPVRTLIKVSRVLRRSVRRDDLSEQDVLVREVGMALLGVLVTQAWYAARLGHWWNVAEGYERGESRTQLSARRQSVQKQVESVALSTMSLPLLWLVALAGVVLTGAPLTEAWIGTAILAAYLALLALLPVVHLMGLPPSATWTRVLSGKRGMGDILPREWLVLAPTLGAILGAFVAAAAEALDWGRTWQAWPVPSVHGAVLGTVAGNLVGITACLAGGARRAPARA